MQCITYMENDQTYFSTCWKTENDFAIVSLLDSM